MAKKKKIFLEMAFWDKFSECCPDRWTDPEKFKKWDHLYDFIRRSSVFVDKPFSELVENAQNDRPLQLLMKSNVGGESDLEVSSYPFPDLESDEEFKTDDYSSVFFSAEDHTQGARKHGVINICCDNIWEQEAKFGDTGVPVKKGERFAWSEMGILQENSNAMVIIDNFLLKQNKQGKCNPSMDLMELLQLSLPHSFSGKYVISIFYYDDGRNAANESSSPEQREFVRESRKDEFYNSIMKFIKNERQGLKVELELFPTYDDVPNDYSKCFHDRVILTNNVWVGSEAGFDMLRRDKELKMNVAKKSTTTHCLYVGFGSDEAKWLDDSYDNRLSEAKQCLARYKYKNPQNRLLK